MTHKKTCLLIWTTALVISLGLVMLRILTY